MDQQPPIISKAQKSYSINCPDFKTWILNIVAICIAFIPVILIVEAYTRIPGSEKVLPLPSPGFQFPQPQVELKFKKYFDNKNFNCLIFGSSIVDAGVDQIVLEKALNPTSKEPLTCMNFGLSGSMLEETSNISRTLINWRRPEVVFLGVAPYDFDSSFLTTRSIARMPVFTYYNGQPTLEGWFFNSFNLPWYFVSLSNQLNPSYRQKVYIWGSNMDEGGMRRSDEVGEVRKNNQEIRLRGYSMNPLDVAALDTMLKELTAKGIKVIIFEMPANPIYYPYFVGGGNQVYQQKFLEPIKQVLEHNEIELIPAPSFNSELYEDEYWYNGNHLNSNGAEIFTTYLATQIQKRGDW